ncbi:unnamed protein product [Peronospora effusa]|nr:unnamed protein product [Peronospora effusa]
MEDMFDSGKCMQQSGIDPIEYHNTDEGFNDHDNGVANEDMDVHMPESASIHERPQWQQMQRSSHQPQYPQHQTAEFLPGSKRHVRTQSLEALSEPPMEKRYGRGASTSGVHLSSVQGTASPLEAMSAHLASIDEEEDEENEEDSTQDSGEKRANQSFSHCARTTRGNSCRYQVIARRSAASVGVLSQFAADPCPTHWQALKRVLRYLQLTPTLGICFIGAGNGKLLGYSDADWAGDTDTRRSTSGYVFVLNNGCISWRSKKQRSVALSSTEAEYMALSEATQEATWLKTFMRELGEEAGDDALTIYEDNEGAIALAKNPEFHKRTKHIDIRYHFVREKVEKNQVVLQYCPTQDMLADIMTKAIAAPKFTILRTKLGITVGVATESSGSVVKKRLGMQTATTTVYGLIS